MFVFKQPLAQGRTADVYLWDDHHILKLFHTWFDLGNIEYEQAIARAVHASGVKAPAVGGIVQTNGRNGLIYERVTGDSMMDLIHRKPWRVLAYARILAHIHAQMHACKFSADVPDQRSRLENKIHHAGALSASNKTLLLEALASLPGGDRVCHGDFHPANVLMDDKEQTVIDWIDASVGNPLADVARTSILALGAAETSQTPTLFMKVFTKLLHSAYLKQYFRLRPGGENEYRRWLPIIAGARLSEEIPELEEWLVRQATAI